MAHVTVVNLSFDRPLQLAIMGALWRNGRLHLHQLHAAVRRHHREVALSTVSTTITRLIAAQWVERIGKGVYQAAITRAELLAVLTQAIEEA